MYIGLDLGTSGLRALLTDGSGDIIATADASYSVSNPRKGWSEQNPEDWIDACQKVLADLRNSHPKQFAALCGIGISGHMHGATLLDSTGNVLRPCILWNDTRSAEQATALDGTPKVREISGNIVFPGFTAPKLLWVEENEPEIFSQVSKVLLPKDYLRLWLTGEYVSDVSDSAGTSWMDVSKREWSGDLLAAGHMRMDHMPDLVEGSEVSGHLRAHLCAEWGLANTVIVAGGGGDNAVAACGVGCFQDGDGFVSLGTSGVLLAAKNSFSPAPETAVHTFCHAVPNTWYQMGVILAATDCLNWLARTMQQSPTQLAGLLSARISGPSETLFLPYLSGERTPHNDSSIRGSFVGLGVATEPADLTQAVMEGVSFALRDNLEALKATGTNFNRILAIGGGSNSPFWLETLATTLGISLEVPESGEFGAALGAARLAIAANTNADLATIMTPPKLAKTIDPSARLADRYLESYARYRSLYPNIKAALS